MLPLGISEEIFSNSGKFIILGRKGAGKSSAQIYIEQEKIKKGYITDYISFYDDISREEYIDFTKTQNISFADYENAKRISAVYDFREVWTRFILRRISFLLKENGFSDPFIDFVSKTSSPDNSIVSGILSGLKIKVDFSLFGANIQTQYDHNSNETQTITVKEYNRICLDLLKRHSNKYKIFINIDELILSNFSSKSDEYEVRIALVRDIIKSTSDLNRFFLENALDYHIVCALRPEVREAISWVEAEIGKIIDSVTAPISWQAPEGDSHPLAQVLRSKIRSGCPEKDWDPIEHCFLGAKINFRNPPLGLIEFILRQTWYRPRDIVRFLITYANTRPYDTRITEDGVRSALDEYSRQSAREIFDEMSVKYGRDLISNFTRLIKKTRFDNVINLCGDLQILENRLKKIESNLDEFCEDLYDVGVIYNSDKTRYSVRIFSSFRGNDRLDHNMPIRIHEGLWSYFKIGHRHST